MSESLPVERAAANESPILAVDGGGSGETGQGEAPAVVAIVVACNPDEHFNETLRSLSNQDYENLSVLVVDAGSDQPIADRVAEALPEAYLHRIAGDPGWSVAANQSIELVSGSPFLLFCHDDVALDPQCVSTLMGELYRNNGGIAGPKLVDWHDDRRLLQIGMGSDRFGVTVDQVDRGEFDQGQHDGVRDVFVIPGGVQLVRADLFAALGGFDTEMQKVGEDLDFCWRAHAAGARVLVVPGAKARHRESLKDRIGLRERRRLTVRHRLRSLLVTSSRRGLFTIVPVAVALILLESFLALATGRRAQARDVLRAIPWNLGHTAAIVQRRRQLSRLRTVSDSELSDLQVSGSARLAAFSRGQFSAGQDRVSDMVGSVRSSLAGTNTGSVRDGTVIGGVLAFVLIFGSRSLLADGVAPVGEIPDVPFTSNLIREWLGGWRTTGTGGPGNAPTALLILGLLRSLFFWSTGFFDTLLVVAPVLLGPLGMYRLARPFASPRAGAIAAVIYASCPLFSSALSAARWEALIVWAAMPFITSSLLRVSAISPFGESRGRPGPTVIPRDLPVRLIRFAILITLVASFATAVVPLAVLLALVLGLGTFVSFGHGRSLVLAAIVAVVGPVALHGPWSYDTLRGLTWKWVVGPGSPEVQFDSMTDLLLFAPGRPGAVILTLGALALAGFSLAFARREFVLFAALGWAVAVTFLLLTWFGRRGWVPFSLPPAEALLAPAAVGVALAVAAGVRSLELDLLGESGGRQSRLLATFGTVVVGLTSLVALVSAIDGRWETPESGFSSSAEFLRTNRADDDVLKEGRVLWIGDPRVLPLDTHETETGITYAVSDSGRAEARGRWQAVSVGSTAGVGTQLDLAQNGEVVRLGRLLAPYGIDLIVVVDRLAPVPYEGPTISPGANVLGSLSQQLDLERVPGVPSLTVFRNTSAGGVAPVLPMSETRADTAADQLDVDLSTSSAGLINYRPGRWLLTMPTEGDVHVAVINSGLTARRTDGAAFDLVSGFDEMTVIPAGPQGQVELDYTRRWPRRAGILAQLLLVGAGLIVAQTRREELA